MGTHPIFESDFDCLTDFALYKKNDGDMSVFGFERVIDGYKAPNGRLLRSADDVKKYLLNGDTCKCGLGKRISLDKFEFTPPPPPLKIRLRHLGAGAWSPANLKTSKVQSQTLPPPPTTVQSTNSTVKRASAAAAPTKKAKKRNLESIMAKLEERRLSSENEAQNENNSNSKSVEDNNIDSYEIIDSFSDSDQKDEKEVTSSTSTSSESIYEAKIFDQLKSTVATKNSFHFNAVKIDDLPHNSPIKDKRPSNSRQKPN